MFGNYPSSLALVAIITTVTVLGTGLFRPLPAAACSCLPPQSATEELQRAAAVFTGTVTEITDLVGDGMKVTFAVDRSWKGAQGPQATVYTADDSAACGYGFFEGQKYLVYANTANERWETGLCSRTSMLDNPEAQADTAELGETIAIFYDTPPAGEAAAEPQAESPLSTSILIALGILAVAAIIGAIIVFNKNKNRQQDIS